jgi:hypothetical protein
LILGWIAAAASITLPLAVPLLSPEAFLRYQASLGVKQKPAETGGAAEMPQYFADRFGWENLTAIVASVYGGLPGHEKQHCVIMGSNYGEAGAINYFGRRHGLPSAFSLHNNHYFWGPPAFEPGVVIHIGGSRELLERYFGEIHVAAMVQSEHAMPYETDLPIYVCRGLKVPLGKAWHASKKFI